MSISPDFKPVHSITVRVYYEDTDLAGIVYHANYLRFFERARTEYLRAIGIDQTAMAADGDGVFFAVRSMDIGFVGSARFDDVLEVQSMPTSVTGARGTMEQRILRGDHVLCTASVMVACVTGNGRPTRMPSAMRTLFLSCAQR